MTAPARCSPSVVVTSQSPDGVSSALRQRLDFGHRELGAVVHRLHLGVRPKLEAGDAVREAGEVLDLLDVDEVAPGHGRLQHKGRAPGSRCEQAGGQSGHPAADDEDVVVRHQSVSFQSSALKLSGKPRNPRPLPPCVGEGETRSALRPSPAHGGGARRKPAPPPPRTGEGAGGEAVYRHSSTEKVPR